MAKANLSNKPQRLTREEVCQLYQISARTLDYLVSTNQIPFSRVGARGVRFAPEALDVWEAERANVDYRTGKSE